MKIAGYDAEITDSWERDDGGLEVYIEVPRQMVQEYFESEELEDDSYTCGDLQYMLNKDGNLEEILLFPVYETEDGLENGEDFVSIDDDEFSEEGLVYEIRTGEPEIEEKR